MRGSHDGNSMFFEIKNVEEGHKHIVHSLTQWHESFHDRLFVGSAFGAIHSVLSKLSLASTLGEESAGEQTKKAMIIAQKGSELLTSSFLCQEAYATFLSALYNSDTPTDSILPILERYFMPLYPQLFMEVDSVCSKFMKGTFVKVPIFQTLISTCMDVMPFDKLFPPDVEKFLNSPLSEFQKPDNAFKIMYKLFNETDALGGLVNALPKLEASDEVIGEILRDFDNDSHWRKFSPEEQRMAESFISEITQNLVQQTIEKFGDFWVLPIWEGPEHLPQRMVLAQYIEAIVEYAGGKLLPMAGVRGLPSATNFTNLDTRQFNLAKSFTKREPEFSLGKIAFISTEGLDKITGNRTNQPSSVIRVCTASYLAWAHNLDAEALGGNDHVFLAFYTTDDNKMESSIWLYPADKKTTSYISERNPLSSLLVMFRDINEFRKCKDAIHDMKNEHVLWYPMMNPIEFLFSETRGDFSFCQLPLGDFDEFMLTLYVSPKIKGIVGRFFPLSTAIRVGDFLQRNYERTYHPEMLKDARVLEYGNRFISVMMHFEKIV